MYNLLLRFLWFSSEDSLGTRTRRHRLLKTPKVHKSVRLFIIASLLPFSSIYYKCFSYQTYSSLAKRKKNPFFLVAIKLIIMYSGSGFQSCWLLMVMQLKIVQITFNLTFANNQKHARKAKVLFKARWTLLCTLISSMHVQCHFPKPRSSRVTGRY